MDGATCRYFDFFISFLTFSGAFALAVVGLAACGLEAIVTHGCTRRRFACVVGVAAAIVASIPLFVWLKGFNHAPTRSDDGRNGTLSPRTRSRAARHRRSPGGSVVAQARDSTA